MTKINKQNTRYIFSITAKPDEGYNIERDFDLTVIAHTREEAIEEAKKVAGEEYKYFKVKDAEPM
jgi:hypothetical protein